MEKLTLDRTLEIINERLILNQHDEIVWGARETIIVLGIIDAVNECTPIKWTGKKIAFYTETRMMSSKQKGAWTVNKDETILCEKEKGDIIEIKSPRGLIFEIDKKSVYLCDED